MPNRWDLAKAVRQVAVEVWDVAARRHDYKVCGTGDGAGELDLGGVVGAALVLVLMRQRREAPGTASSAIAERS